MKKNELEMVDISKPYAFISYSHADNTKVFRLLRILEENGKLFWYDHGINVSDDWCETINHYFDHSSKFILFLSNGVEQRPEVIREIKMAIEKNKETNGSYRIYAILLERIPISYIFRDEQEILEFMYKIQYISLEKYGGITVKFIEDFVGDVIWPEDSGKGGQGVVGTLASYEDVETDSTYIYPQAAPLLYESDEVTFYTVKIGETDPNTKYPICIDNQWCPIDYYENPVFRENGFKDENLKKNRNMYQRNEMYRALIHDWQVLINRASVFNTEALIEWYTKDEYYDSFCELLENGSFVIYLMTEKTPMERPRFDVPEKTMEKWIKLCKEHKTFCIKMNWDDENSNKYDVEVGLYTPFKEMLLTTADNQNRLSLFCRAMNITGEDKKSGFRNRWKTIQSRVIDINSAEIKGYARQQFYEDFLVRESDSEEERDGSNVTDCLLDYDKEFVCELKQIIDFCYMMNLPNALHIQPMIDFDNKLSEYNLFEKRAFEHYRQISVEEVYCSVLQFNPTFLDANDMYVADKKCMDLNIVNKIRKFIEWRSYIEASDAGIKRANLNEIDFFDVRNIWGKYKVFIDKCQENFKEFEWRKERGTLSVIYRIGGSELISIYRAGMTPQENVIDIIKRMASEDGSSNAREILTVEYVCGDIARMKEDCLLTKETLFQGLLNDKNQDAFQRIDAALVKNTWGKYNDRTS